MVKSIGGDWVECFDEDRNKYYYANVKTKETSWAFPPSLLADKAVVDRLDYWVEAVDAKSNRKYYYNKITRESKWTKPECLKPRKSNNKFMNGSGFSGLKRPENYDDTEAVGEANDTARSRSQSPVFRGVALPGMEDRCRATSPSPTNRAPGLGPGVDKGDRDICRAPMDPERAVSPYRGVALPGMEDGNRALSPSLAVAKSYQHGGAAVGARSDHSKTNKFAALRELERQRVEIEADEMHVGYDGSGMRVTQLLPPPPVSFDDRCSMDVFPGRPSFVNEDHATLSIFDSLEADGLCTSEIFMHATRTLVEYAELHYVFERKGLFNRRTSVEKLLCWKGELLSQPLHHLQGELRDDAVQIFRNITGFMGDRASQKSQKEHAHKILTLCLLSTQELRDETFCQLCKQLTANPSVTSRANGWHLMLICLTTISPSDELLPSVLQFFKVHIQEESDVSVVAEIALHKCFKSTQLGNRHEVPSVLEMEALRHARFIQVRIWFVDGSHIVMDCDSWVSVGEMEDMIAVKLGVRSPSAFGLFEVSTTEDERSLLSEERVLDLVAVWQHIELEDIAAGKTPIVEEFRFFYKVKYFVDLDESDVAGAELMYIQAVFDVVNSTYLCLISDAYTLAALQLQVLYGDYAEGSMSLIRYSLAFFLPERNLVGATEMELCSNVLNKYRQLIGFTYSEAMLGYLDFVKEFPSYGCAYFFAKPTSSTRNLPTEVAISISRRGLAIVDNYTKEYIEKFDYDNIITWGHSPNQFVLAVGTTAKQQKITFKCVDGKEISDTIHAYIDWRTNGSSTTNK